MGFSDWRTQRRKFLKFLVPVGVFLGMVYLSWIFSYIVCWNEVYQHHSKSTGIGLIVGNVLLLLILYFTWIQLALVGAGKQPVVPLYRLIKDDRNDYRAIEPPNTFMSDKNGYPIWCSTCQSIKVDRSHHSSDLNYCVPKFDHFCTWIGCLIGKKNYRLFIQFSFWYLFYFIYIGVGSASFTKQIKQRKGEVNPNLIVLYIFDVLWIILISALVGSHIYYIYFNMTSIDDMARKRDRRARTQHDQYINVSHKGQRYVLLVNPDKDYVWNKGFVKNWYEAMGENPLFWVIPWRSNVKNLGDAESDCYSNILGDYNEEISENWAKQFEERIENGDYISKIL